MSLGGSPDIPDIPPVALAPSRVTPDVKKAKSDLSERLKRARSRELSLQTTPGLLKLGAPAQRPVLSDLL